VVSYFSHKPRLDCRYSLDSIIHGIPLDGFEARVFDHGNEFLFAHFDLAVLDRIAFGELAAVGDGAVVVASFLIAAKGLLIFESF